jgi:hypothetical protein
LGDDLRRVEQNLSREARSEPLRLRLLERGDVLPIVMPPWTLDASGGDCTTLVVLAPVPTQFVVRVHPWQDLPSTFMSRAGAFQLTRCGKARVSLVQVSVELRSPRAVLYPLVAVGAEPPPPLEVSLPARSPGRDTPSGDPGPPPARELLEPRLERFDVAAEGVGATSTERLTLPTTGSTRLLLEPGCHRLLVSARRPGVRLGAVLSLGDDAPTERLEPTSTGDLRRELCTVRPRQVELSLTASGDDERTLAVAHFPLPQGLPRRFGVALAERLLDVLGRGMAPRKLGPLVAATLGAQGRTPLPQQLLPHTCYLAVALAARGTPTSLSLRASSGATSSEGGSDGGAGARIGFCTDKNAHADVEVEARGLGLAWLFLLFQQGPGQGVAR